MTLIILISLTIILLIATMLPLSGSPHWTVRGMDFPRFQIAVLATVLLITDFSLLDLQSVASWAIILITVLCLLWQLWWILPYTSLWKKEVKWAKNATPERTLTILTSNVLTPNHNSEALIQLVKKHSPDILVTLETDQWWENKLNALESEMPYSVKCPLDNLYGMHLYSSLPIEEEKVSYLVEKDVPSIHVILTLKSGDKVRGHFIHPAPPSPSENTESTERDVELVIVGKSVAESSQPIIVTGDLNDVAWSATTRLFRKISGLLDPRIGRGMYNTFHAKYPFLRWPLDHLFHSEHFTVKSIQRLPSIDSDHFPLLTSLCFAPAEGADQEGIDADQDDLERSEEIKDQKEADKNDVPEPGE